MDRKTPSFTPKLRDALAEHIWNLKGSEFCGISESDGDEFDS
jgi:hypothetical protein